MKSLTYYQKGIFNTIEDGGKMNKEQIRVNLAAIYLDYYDGIYTEQQLKYMLLKLQGSEY
jgi:hypothetical protein